ncbi:hypothetical protein [Streptomyces lydicus]|uniref:hypothetical protein n=1 Tax=Streptomyces lydicus TaxID=47763 RepID=UPI00342E2557
MPKLAGHGQAVKFDAGTGRLDVAPVYGTKLRWSTPKLIAAEQRAGARRERPHPARPAARARADWPRHGGRRSGPAVGGATGAPDAAGRLPARARAQRSSRTPTTVAPAIQAAAEWQARQQAREREELFGDGQAALQALRNKATWPVPPMAYGPEPWSDWPTSATAASTPRRDNYSAAHDAHPPQAAPRKVPA